MDDLRLGRLVRALRHARRWRQADLARRAGVTREIVSGIERGRACDVRLRSVRDILGAFGASLDLGVRGLGAEVDRLLDERHARLLGAAAAWLTSLGWQVEAEVSYSEWGERGSIDLLAIHTLSGALLVVEVKTELVSIEATLRKLDEKARLGTVIAERRVGRRATSVGRLVILPDDRTVRRRIAAHQAVLGLALPVRTAGVRAWCRSPDGRRALSRLMFLTEVAPARTMAPAGRRELVRRPRDADGEPGPTAAAGAGASMPRGRTP